MTTTTISPFVVGDAQEVELTAKDGTKKKLWKKEILPSGTRQYKGQTLDFSKINPSCVKAFEEKAMGETVPFVLALSDNKHPGTGREELESLEGDMVKAELSKDGRAWGYFDFSGSPETEQRIRKSKAFGVSSRIEVDYTAEDTGKRYEYALSHICGTTRPHIKNMAGWEPVELSEDEKKREVVDFSTEVVEAEETNTEKETGDDLVTVNIPKEQLDKLMAFIGDFESATQQVEGEGGEEGGSNEATLSEADNKRIELAEQAAKDAYAQAERSQIELAETRWNARKAQLVREGVPPVIVELAEPLLKLHKRPTIELTETSTGNKSVLDAAEVLEKVLDACKGTIKLGEEQGHSISDGTAGVDKEYDAFEKEFFAEFGNM